MATYNTYDSNLMGIDSLVSGLVVLRYSVALSTNPATLYHPRRPDFATTLLLKPNYTVKWGGGGDSVVILSGSCKYEYFTAK